MRIIINHSSMIPIYEQIVDQIKKQINNHTLKENDALPSVRSLAKELQISALTVKKAYDFLENEGLTKTIHGKGTFVLAVNKDLLEEAKKEIERTKYDERLNKLSHYYFDRYSNDLHLFKDVFKCNLIEQFKHFQDIGVLEIITCGATHGYFPILYVTEETIRAQIAVGVQTYEKYFGRKPRGIWLPECGYVPEADKYLREFGIEYFPFTIPTLIWTL